MNRKSFISRQILKIVLIGFSQNTLAQSPTWNQNKEWKETHPHVVFKDQKATHYPDSTDAGVLINNRVPGHGPNYIQIEYSPSTFERVHKAQFQHEVSLSKSVFVATSGTGTSRGTAFLVGDNLVLTNKHVLGSGMDCGKFSVNLNHKNETVTCKSVEYCDKTEDFCLVRLNSMKNGNPIGSEVPALPLQPQNSIKTKKEMLIAIGNAYGVGVQSASFKGIKKQGNTLFHCIRTFPGNSGSPILDTNFQVLGINFGREFPAPIRCPEDRMPGTAVTSEYILKKIKKLAPSVYNEIKVLDSRTILEPKAGDVRQSNQPYSKVKTKDTTTSVHKSKIHSDSNVKIAD